MEQPSDRATSGKPNTFQRIAGVFVSPAETLRDIATRPDWLIPLILIALIGAVGSFIVAPHLDFETGMREQFEKQGMSERQQERAIEFAGKFASVMIYFSVVTAPLMMLAIGGIFMLAFRVFGGEGTFRQYFALTIYSWMPQMLKSIILTGIVASRETVRVEQMPGLVKSNLTFLAGSPTESPVAYVLLSSLDLFTIWTLVLMVIGYAHASRVKRGKAGALVIGIWLATVLARMGLAAIQGAAG